MQFLGMFQRGRITLESTEYVRIRKEMVVPCLSILYRHFLEWLRKTTKSLLVIGKCITKKFVGV